MKTIRSVEFRKGYAKLTEAAEVTANGRPIGYWYPAYAAGVVVRENPTRLVAVEDIEDAPPSESGAADPRHDWHLRNSTAKERQASRDAILRKINRGG